MQNVKRGNVLQKWTRIDFNVRVNGSFMSVDPTDLKYSTIISPCSQGTVGLPWQSTPRWPRL